MGPWRATEDGFVTPDVIDWYRRFAEGKPGVLVVEATGIRDVPSGPLLRIGHDRFIDGLAQLVRAVETTDGSVVQDFPPRVRQKAKIAPENLARVNDALFAVVNDAKGTAFPVRDASLEVVVDDADLPFGEIRLRAGGSSGGHHGLESIEQHLASREFARLRIGIGRADGAREITNFVLGKFDPSESAVLEKVLERAAKQVETWLAAGI